MPTIWDKHTCAAGDLAANKSSTFFYSIQINYCFCLSGFNPAARVYYLFFKYYTIVTVFDQKYEWLKAFSTPSFW